MVPVWVFNLLFHNVLPDALEYLSGIFGSPGPEGGRNAFVDL